MDINLIKYQKTSSTYSSETIDSALNTVHTAKPNFAWTPDDNTNSEWIKFNFYDSTYINKIIISYDGTCDSVKLEYSLDNINWKVLKDTWTMSRNYEEIELDTPVEIIILRFQVNNTDSFVGDLEVYSDIDFTNTHIISHNYFMVSIKVNISYSFLDYCQNFFQDNYNLSGFIFKEFRCSSEY